MGGLDHCVHINMATLMNGMVGPLRNISTATPMNGMVGPMGVMKHGNSHDGMVGLMQYLSMVGMLCKM